MRLLQLALIITLLCPRAGAQSEYPKKLIQFGWDYPTITVLKKNIKNMERRPFDGVAFSFDFKIFDLFDSTNFPDDKFQFDDLKQIQWSKFTDNFLIVRGQSLNGPNWLNDRAWDKILVNTRKISKALAFGNAKGILFDPEYYYADEDKNPWIYNAHIYGGLSYNEVGKYVRKRGEQFIKSLQSYKHDPQIFGIWLLSLVTLQARQTNLENTGMALYPFFVEGIMAGKNKDVLVTDGNELAYSYMLERQFLFSGDEIRDWGRAFMPDSLKTGYQEIRIAQPVYYDLIYGKSPVFENQFNADQKKNWLMSNLYFAFKTSDKYVWLYNENLNWWQTNNTELATLILSVKDKLKMEFKQTAQPGSIISGKSGTWNFLKNEFEPSDVFIYTYSQASRILTVEFETTVDEFFVIQNSRLRYSVSGPAKKLSIYLSAFNGSENLILAAKKGKYVVAFLN